MKTPTLSITLLLLLLSLLLSQAQGIRLDKGFISARKQNNNIQEDEPGVTKTSSNVAGSEDSSTLINSCKDGGECSSSGSTRKLISMTSSTTTTTVSKNEKNNARNHRADPAPKGEKVKTQVVLGGEDGNAKAKRSSSVVSKHLQAVHQHYPDLADITEMDYSPARRKPPIHN